MPKAIAPDMHNIDSKLIEDDNNYIKNNMTAPNKSVPGSKRQRGIIQCGLILMLAPIHTEILGAYSAQMRQSTDFCRTKATRSAAERAIQPLQKTLSRTEAVDSSDASKKPSELFVRTWRGLSVTISRKAPAVVLMRLTTCSDPHRGIATPIALRDHRSLAWASESLQLNDRNTEHLARRILPIL